MTQDKYRLQLVVCQINSAAALRTYLLDFVPQDETWGAHNKSSSPIKGLYADPAVINCHHDQKGVSLHVALPRKGQLISLKLYFLVSPLPTFGFLTSVPGSLMRGTETQVRGKHGWDAPIGRGRVTGGTKVIYVTEHELYNIGWEQLL